MDEETTNNTQRISFLIGLSREFALMSLDFSSILVAGERFYFNFLFFTWSGLIFGNNGL